MSNSLASNDFWAAIICEYFALPISRESLAEELEAAGGTDLELDSQSPHGAYVYYPDCKSLRVGDVSKKRILTGLWAHLNGPHIVDILLYVEDGRITLVEMAAPLDDMPLTIEDFKFVKSPNQKIKIE